MTAIFGEHESGWDPRFDDGLTRERTLLAWHRTGLAFLVNAVLIAKGFENTDVAIVGYVVGLVGGGLGLFTYVTGGFRFQNRFWQKRIGRARDRAFRTVSMGSTAIATAAVVLTLTA